MHTVNLKPCPKSLDFYFKGLPKYLAATGFAKKWTCTARNTGFGYMTGADAILGTAKGPSHASHECCCMCVCSLEEKAFYVFQHVISSPALPSQSRCCCFLVDMWETRDSCMVRWYAAQPSSTSSRCFLSSVINISMHLSCVVKWDPIVKSI